MKELGQPLVTYTMILDAFQSEFPMSGYKNVTTLKRRLNALVRKKVELAANMEIFVTETIHMMVGLSMQWKRRIGTCMYSGKFSREKCFIHLGFWGGLGNFREMWCYLVL